MTGREREREDQTDDRKGLSERVRRSPRGAGVHLTLFRQRRQRAEDRGRFRAGSTPIPPSFPRFSLFFRFGVATNRRWENSSPPLDFPKGPLIDSNRVRSYAAPFELISAWF
eukprot:1724508-Rhodomonas_salina.1